MGGRASFGTSSKLKARTLSSAHFCLRNQSTELSTDRDFPHFHSHSQRERSKEKATTTTIDIYYLLGATRIIQGATLECGSLLPPWFGEACFAISALRRHSDRVANSAVRKSVAEGDS